jgi:hypothetical protein
LTLRHPLDFLPSSLRRPLFFLFLALTAAGFAVFQLLDQPLRTAAALAGTVSFELAGSVEKARAMMDSWDASARLNNAFGLGFDFLFMPVYATALSLGVLLAVGRRRGIWSTLGKALGWGVFAATGFDSVENIALFSILHGNIVAPYPQVAAWCASVKFVLILLGTVYGLIGWLLPEKRS